MFKNKKILILVIILLMSATLFTLFCGFTFADTNNSSLVVSENEAADFAQHWVNANYSEYSNINKQIATIYNLDNTVYGYYIVFNDNDNLLGYLITNCDKTSDNIIIEYSLDGGALFEINQEERLYFYGGSKYGYNSDQEGVEYFKKDDYKTNTSPKKASRASKPNIYEGINDMDLDR